MEKSTIPQQPHFPASCREHLWSGRRVSLRSLDSIIYSEVKGQTLISLDEWSSEGPRQTTGREFERKVYRGRHREETRKCKHQARNQLQAESVLMQYQSQAGKDHDLHQKKRYFVMNRTKLWQLSQNDTLVALSGLSPSVSTGHRILLGNAVHYLENIATQESTVFS